MYKIYRTAAFDKEFLKLQKAEQIAIEKFEKKLVENPYIGKSLNYAFLREKKLNGKRAYYLIYDDFVIVLMIAISDKKTQQATIDKIKEHLDSYYKFVKETLGKI